ncbi:transporter substrate-binding domain-containing protein [Bacteriovorax sp. Seq25_V]|uniref:transporter substrate-binding domain-containing protein n=1 Tax=Bacteriovorax sp. Seq25_V TaxID=1201288 RepID=UPI00038A2898|nr:transporter substrate-binding domain-containing protein [Bacteriovorax sp. Seq25_V]EQC46603.1 ABC transporter, substrate-binding protein, family 3 [Bacteriovorax sp. Seq25_V]
MKILFILIFLRLSCLAREIVFMSPVAFAPWVEVSTNKEVKGVMVNISRDLEKRIGEKVQFKYKPYKRFVRDLEGGVDFDITLFTVDSNAKLSGLVKVEPSVNVNRTYLFFHNKMKTCKDIKTLVTVGVSTHENTVKEKCNTSFNLISTKSIDQRVKLFLDGKGDSLLIGEQELLKLDSDTRILIEKKKSILLKYSESFLMINKNSILNSKKYERILSDFSKEVAARYFLVVNEGLSRGTIHASLD